MNILVIHEVDWHAKVIFEMHEFPERLALRGHHVVFVDYEESYTRRGSFDLIRLRTRVDDNGSRTCSGATIQVRTPGLVKLPVLDRLSSGLTQFLEIEKVIREQRIDVVLLYGIATNGLSTIAAARLHEVPVAYRAIDVLYRLRPPPVSAAIWLAERLCLPLVDAVISLSPALSEYVRSMGYHGAPPEVLLSGMDRQKFRPGPKDTELLARYGLQADDCVAMFLGTMYDFSGVDHVIQSFGAVRRRVPNAKLLLVGGSRELPVYRQLAKDSGNEDAIVFTDFQPLQMLPAFINSSDVTFCSFRRFHLTDTVIPEKLPRYLACGKPLLCTPLRGVRSLMGGEENGVVFRDLGPDFMTAMADLLEDSSWRARLGTAAVKYVEENHDPDVQVDRLEALLADLAGRRRRSRRVP